MKAIFANIGKGLLEIAKEIDWRGVAYKAVNENLMPYLRAKAKDTESKWDDIMVDGLDAIVQKFLKPDAS